MNRVSSYISCSDDFRTGDRLQGFRPVIVTKELVSITELWKKHGHLGDKNLMCRLPSIRNNGCFRPSYKNKKKYVVTEYM